MEKLIDSRWIHFSKGSLQLCQNAFGNTLKLFLSPRSCAEFCGNHLHQAMVLVSFLRPVRFETSSCEDHRHYRSLYYHNVQRGKRWVKEQRAGREVQTEKQNSVTPLLFSGLREARLLAICPRKGTGH